MTATKHFDIAIVGGGISGLTLAVALLKQNVPFTVYESAPKFTEIGAGLGFGPNAVKAVELISPELLEGLKRRVTLGWESKRQDWFTIRVGDQKKAGPDGVLKQKEKEGLKVGDPLFEIQYGDDRLAGGVHRAHFLDELLALIPDSVSKFGKRLVDITSATDGSQDAVLHFADGTTAQHSAVVGCDGIKSKTREILLGEKSKAVFSGKYAYRGLIPMGRAVELLGAETAENPQLWMGYHRHLLTFPIEKGKTMNVVAFSSRDTWTDLQWVVKASKEEMLADYTSWGPAVNSIINSMEKRDVWALFNDPPAETYYGLSPRVCLLGDAAHGTTPHQGAGAGMCIEDCYILGHLIGAAQSTQDLDKAFKAYDEVRRPRTLKLVKTSREAGMLYEFELEGDDLEAIERNLKSRMSWIWDVDLQHELERALSIFKG
ncbi:FAD/NAD(P)-binding domain-containing protein [Daldinia caldariorum]|uniref:FAD/NAD(P)-binding domain-containing protein n=1 Tax=Daldinia caldariorum TaxID=326644 RepID=UPI00200849D0|nr:FAD/NAD(P)-binding domain-containing protein [Daldinia caldariorum]KAI1472220.1 FAD/NAD(P)-binding domain-containing protein [Daldinia caldariorum]